MGRLYFFHLKTPKQLERDDVGIVCENLEAAYLTVCRTIPDVAGDVLRERQNPMECSYIIADEKGMTMFEVPFFELVASMNKPLPTAHRPVPCWDPSSLKMAEDLRRRAGAALEKSMSLTTKNRATVAELRLRATAAKEQSAQAEAALLQARALRSETS